tara:strand:+ start:515 stop:1180 length:666 start_codon:yes stop_codon:yes gene_type:complete
MSHKNIPVITIDGLASSGKTSISKKLSKALSYYFLDSGILYRAVAFVSLKKKLIDELKLLECIKKDLKLNHYDNNEFKVSFKELDITNMLYSEEIGTQASIISQDERIRDYLMSMQHSCVRLPGLVANGRDMGTKVFPHAKLKLFITADLEIRAKRRFDQLLDSGIETPLDVIKKSLEERDKSDRNRKISPLIAANDAIELDSSNLNVDRILDKILELYKI